MELGAARVCCERRPEVEFTTVASMADGGGSGSRAWRPASFYRQACLGEGGHERHRTVGRDMGKAVARCDGQ
jgi:hypothetical protein